MQYGYFEVLTKINWLPKWELSSDESVALVGTEPQAWCALKNLTPEDFMNALF